MRSIDYEDGRPRGGTCPVRRAIVVSDLPAGSSSQLPFDSVRMFNEHLSRQDEDDMTLVTPKVSDVRRAVFNQSELDLAKLACPHRSDTRFAWVLRCTYGRPIRHAGR